MVWSMGHKFIPVSTCKQEFLVKELCNEAYETGRKIGWRKFFSNNAPQHDVRLIKWKRGTPLPTSLWERMEPFYTSFAREASIQITNDTFSARIPSALLRTKWRQLLNSVNGRWICCDKNLGIKLISHEEYQFLAHTEALRYETLISGKENITTTARNIISQKVITLRAFANRCIPLEQGKIIKGYFWSDLREMITFSINKPESEFNLPKLKLLLKVHKGLKDGHYQTRPIVPTFGLPEYELSKFTGKMLAIYCKANFEWVLPNTDEFVDWLAMPIRTGRIKCFDFSNLYGNEPVKETLNIFIRCLNDQPMRCSNDKDQSLWNFLCTELMVPAYLTHILPPRAKAIVIMTAMCVENTSAILDMGDGSEKLITTTKFLAMGSSPVAPLSNITLGYLEWRRLSPVALFRGMRRLIDDIVIDEHFVSEEELRRVYPTYLTLNDSSDGHFLDVEFLWDGFKFLYWVYMKPFITTPLNFNSTHPMHTKIASARNELKRLLRRTNLTDSRSCWTKLWITRYSLAGYPTDLLCKIIRQVATGWKYTKEPDNAKDIFYHVETYRGSRTPTASLIEKHEGMRVRTSWRVMPTLLSMINKIKRRQSSETVSFYGSFCDLLPYTILENRVITFPFLDLEE